MPTNHVAPDYLPRGLSRYVSGAAYVDHPMRDGFVTLSLGSPAALSATHLLSAASNATAGTFFTFASTYSVVNGLSGRYGRCVQIVASAAASNVVRVRGFDYLGQPMREDLTLNGITAVIGVKAFRYVSSYEIVTGTAATTINLGTTDKLGLPFKTLPGLFELNGNNVNEAETLVNGSETNPQTATSTDPRGTCDPTTALNGSVEFKATYMVDTNNTFGFAHFFA